MQWLPFVSIFKWLSRADAHPWLSCHFDFLVMKANAKISGHHPERKLQISAFSEGWIRSGEHRMWLRAIFYIKGIENSWKWLILPYLAIHINSNDIISNIKNDYDALNRHHFNAFQWFLEFQRIHWGVTGVICSANFTDNRHSLPTQWLLWTYIYHSTVIFDCHRGLLKTHLNTFWFV